MIVPARVRTLSAFCLAAALATGSRGWGQNDGAQPEQPTPSSASASASEAEGELTVGPGDLLTIEVVGLDELDRKARVANDGTIRLPLVGALQVRDLTPSQVEQLVASALRDKKLVNDAAVAVVVEEYLSHGVSVMGAVAKPGTYQVVGVKTVFDILLEAGGVTGDAREIIIIREHGPDRSERIRVDAAKLLVEGDLSHDVQLEAGDVLVVPAETKLKVFVNGAVASQGPIEYIAGHPLGLLQAVSAAGGASERANLEKVKILRRRADGSPEVIVVNLKRVRKGVDPDVMLEENDIVVIGERFF